MLKSKKALFSSIMSVKPVYKQNVTVFLEGRLLGPLLSCRVPSLCLLFADTKQRECVGAPETLVRSHEGQPDLYNKR